MEENAIKVIIVYPKNMRIYNYWINGSLEKRSMLQRKMREFCLDLSPENAKDINRCIYEITPFIIYVEKNRFQELNEADPIQQPKANRVFPLRKKIYSKENVHLTKKSDDSVSQGKRFNIWEKFNIKLDQNIKSSSIFSKRNSF
ncbi:MAG: hypothetical protein ACRCZB_05250 [Bacteroidales bacterium]